MLTARGWWMLASALGLVGLGLGVGLWHLALVGLTLLGWFLAAWFVFMVRLRWVVPRLSVSRRLANDKGPLTTLWAGQTVDVEAELHNPTGLLLPFAWAIDRVPLLADLFQGDEPADPQTWPLPPNQAQGSVGRQALLRIRYRIHCPGAGSLRFEGLAVQLADLQGFFESAIFVRSPHRYRVLPPLANVRGQMPTRKRHNTLPLQGTHRHPRPGSGGELLDLRDYMPGDPPKMIAWKASARRDRLITKEFESEVPVRCTLFVDVSSSVRVGRVGRNVLARLIDVSSAVVQASAAVKDLTGLCLFDETGVRKMVRPGRGSRHVLELLHHLADCADLPVKADHVALAQLIPLAHGLAEEVYPELLEGDVNAFPWWLPFWSPQPGYTRRIPVVTAGGPWSAPFAWLENQWRRGVYELSQSVAGRLLPSRRRLYRWRKQVAALVAVRHELGPGGLGLLLEDDDLCRAHLMRFLGDHQVPPPVSLFDADGRYQFASPEKVGILARAVLGSVVRGRDNELFVLVVDLLEVGTALDELVHAVQVARGRHHQVLLLCPWPGQIPPPARQAEAPGSAPRAGTLQELYYHAAAVRLHQAARTVRRTFAQLGVNVRFSSDDDAVPLILRQMTRLRIQERGRP